MLTNELPTIIPSAPYSIILCPSLGVLIPKPTAKCFPYEETIPFERDIDSNVYFSNLFLDPVIPKTDTIYTKPVDRADIFLNLLVLVLGEIRKTVVRPNLLVILK